MATAPVSDTLDRIGTALADPSRRQILLMLLQRPTYPADLAEALSTTRPNVSNHLACLRGCGLVRATREGRQVRYRLASDDLADALRLLVNLELEVQPSHADLDGRPWHE